MVFVCHFAPAYFFAMRELEKQMKKVKRLFDKKNICSYNISIATLEMLIKSIVGNLVSFDFPFGWLSVEGG